MCISFVVKNIFCVLGPSSDKDNGGHAGEQRNSEGAYSIEALTGAPGGGEEGVQQ